MNIGVVGTGYVGLVVGACLAENGNFVVCVDNDAAKVKRLRQGEIPIYEPGLNELVPRNVAEERLSFTTDLAEAVRSSEVLFIAVGTPQDEDGSADLTHVLAVAREIGRADFLAHLNTAMNAAPIDWRGYMDRPLNALLTEIRTD